MTREELKRATSGEFDSLLAGSMPAHPRVRILDPARLARQYADLIRDGEWSDVDPVVLHGLLKSLSEDASRNLDRRIGRCVGDEGPILSGAEAQEALDKVFAALRTPRGTRSKATLYEDKILKAWKGVYARKVLGQTVKTPRPGDCHRERAELSNAIFHYLGLVRRAAYQLRDRPGTALPPNAEIFNRLRPLSKEDRQARIIIKIHEAAPAVIQAIPRRGDFSPFQDRRIADAVTAHIFKIKPATVRKSRIRAARQATG